VHFGLKRCALRDQQTGPERDKAIRNNRCDRALTAGVATQAARLSLSEDELIQSWIKQVMPVDAKITIAQLSGQLTSAVPLIKRAPAVAGWAQTNRRFKSMIATIPQRPTGRSLSPPRLKRPSPQLRSVWRPLGSAPMTVSIRRLDPHLVLAVGNSKADPEKVLHLKTATGLKEHERFLALNECNVDDLQSFHNFRPRVAPTAIEFRAPEKFFSSLDELVRVPLIGPTRFSKLVGRESQFYTLALHAAQRQPAPLTLRVNDLQPLIWPAPGVPRIYLGSDDDEKTETTYLRRVIAFYIRSASASTCASFTPTPLLFQAGQNTSAKRDHAGSGAYCPLPYERNHS
jgi:hypothetical protein